MLITLAVHCEPLNSGLKDMNALCNFYCSPIVVLI